MSLCRCDLTASAVWSRLHETGWAPWQGVSPAVRDRKAVPKILYLVTEDFYFYSHRLPMARAAMAEGFEVAVITNIVNHQPRIEAENIRIIPFSLDRGSLNPFKALLQLWRLIRLYQSEKPDIVHHVAMKPVLYGSIAAWIAGVPAVINAFAGLGYLFTGQSLTVRALRATLTPLFRPLLKLPGSHLLLQNNDDLALLRQYRLVPEDRVTIIRGSGVDLKACKESTMNPPKPDFICVFAGRMIEIKGLATLQEAFAILEKSAPRIKLWLCGKPDPANPGPWTEERLKAWEQAAPNVTYKGHSDMPEIWASAHLAIQPSYGGEGVPKSLLEAAACGRAIIATDVPGCRDVVDNGRNGYLVPPRDAKALAEAIKKMALAFDQCANMGHESRKLVEEKGFSAEDVTQETASLYRSCLKG